MNIVYIHTHDTGRMISPYGYPAETPFLQEFAEDAITFRNMHCVCPTCSPSRSALLTGRYPHNNGMLGLAHMKFALHDYKEHLSARLRERGYRTVLCGVQHETSDLDHLSYDRILTKGIAGYDQIGFRNWDQRNAELAAEFVHGYREERPFFLSFGMVNTHRPYLEDEKNDERYLRPPLHMPDNAENRRDFAQFLSGVRVVDNCFGILLKALKERGFYENSLILFTTDHGIAYPHMKCNLTDWGTGVAFLLRVPDGGKGIVCDQMLSQLDFLPTLYEYMGWEPLNSFQGKSFANLLRQNPDDRAPVHEEIFGEVTFHAAYQPMRSVREERYHYILHFDDGKVIPVNIDAGIAKDFVLRYGFSDMPPCREFLFDLMLDPCEKVNLANETSHEKVKERLRKKLFDHMRATDDLLLIGVEGIHGKPIWNRSGNGMDERFL